MNYRKPTSRLLADAPAEGPIVALTIEPDERAPRADDGGPPFPTVVSSALLGPGRDYADRDACVAAQAAAAPGLLVVTVSRVYETVGELVADYPTANLDGTARRMLAAERERVELAAAVELWEQRIEAAGLEPCGRCGGPGGWRGWPGWTCYRCGGRGVQARKGRRAPESPSKGSGVSGAAGRGGRA